MNQSLLMELILIIMYCLKHKGVNGVCKTRRCTEEKTIPQVLLCAACTPWAAAKGWASFSILMCRKQEHGKDRPKPAEVRKFLEKYLGKINTAIADNSLSYAVNFNFQVFSVCDLPIPASTSALHLIPNSALKLTQPQSRLFLKFLSTRFILCNG